MVAEEFLCCLTCFRSLFGKPVRCDLLQFLLHSMQRWAVPNYFCTELQNRITFFVPVPTGAFENSTGTDLLVLLQNRYFFRYF